jgi:hypothetical protein
MNTKVFVSILAVSVTAVLLQGFLSWTDGYLTQAQLHSRGINGWSLVEHAGVWADLFLISPMLAYVLATYRLAYFSIPSLAILAMTIAVTLIAKTTYQELASAIPEAHTHDGQTTAAGWVHVLYATLAIWICALVYLNLSSPSVSMRDLSVISVLLTVFFFFGVAKFSTHWAIAKHDVMQIALQAGAIWSAVAARFVLNRVDLS